MRSFQGIQLEEIGCSQVNTTNSRKPLLLLSQMPSVSTTNDDSEGVLHNVCECRAKNKVSGDRRP